MRKLLFLRTRLKVKKMFNGRYKDMFCEKFIFFSLSQATKLLKGQGHEIRIGQKVVSLDRS